MTHPFFKFNKNTIIELSREGGFAYIPALADLRRLSLADMPDDQRTQLCQLISPLAHYARTTTEPTVPGSGGDQRYFLITLREEPQKTETDITLEIPESDMPAALISLWKSGMFSSRDPDALSVSLLKLNGTDVHPSGFFDFFPK